MAGRQVPARSIALEDGAVSLSVRETARILGVSPCSVYGYLARGRLAKYCVDERIMLREDEVLAFADRLHAWPSEPFPALMLTVHAPVRPGCAQRLDEKLDEFYQQNKHILPGTSRQLFARNVDGPERLTIVLLWPDAAFPTRELHQQALAVLADDLAEVCDWEAALIFEGSAPPSVG